MAEFIKEYSLSSDNDGSVGYRVLSDRTQINVAEDDNGKIRVIPTLSGSSGTRHEHYDRLYHHPILADLKEPFSDLQEWIEGQGCTINVRHPEVDTDLNRVSFFITPRDGMTQEEKSNLVDMIAARIGLMQLEIGGRTEEPNWHDTARRFTSIKLGDEKYDIPTSLFPLLDEEPKSRAIQVRSRPDALFGATEEAISTLRRLEGIITGAPAIFAAPDESLLQKTAELRGALEHALEKERTRVGENIKQADKGMLRNMLTDASTIGRVVLKAHLTGHEDEKEIAESWLDIKLASAERDYRPTAVHR